MAAAWTDLTAPGSAANAASTRWLIEHLLSAETGERGVRSVQYQMNAARFPARRDLAGFDFEAGAVDRALIMRLADLSFTDGAQNAVFVGDPGTGKTHLASAIGIAGIAHTG